MTFDAILRPERDQTQREAVAGHFRQAIHRDHDQTHVVDRWLVHPVMCALSSLARLVAAMHSGRVNTYAAYVLLSLVVMLVVKMLI